MQIDRTVDQLFAYEVHGLMKPGQGHLRWDFLGISLLQGPIVYHE